MPTNVKDKNILFTSIRLMICVGHADGYMGEKERSSIYQMVNSEHFNLRERQILMDDMDDPKSAEVLLADVQELEPSAKLTILRQMYHIALVDGKLSGAEQLEIRRIASLLGIREEKQTQVEAWIYEGMAWRERWQEIVGE